METGNDLDLAAAEERSQRLEKQYGNLGRRTITADGLNASVASDFVESLRRLEIPEIPSFALVPRNLETSPDTAHLVYEREAKDLQALANQSGLALVPLTGSDVSTVHENDSTIILGTLYAAYDLVEKLNGFATVLEFFKNVSKFFGARLREGGAEVELSQEVIVSKKAITRRISFKGPASNLSQIVTELVSICGGIS